MGICWLCLFLCYLVSHRDRLVSHMRRNILLSRVMVVVTFGDGAASLGLVLRSHMTDGNKVSAVIWGEGERDGGAFGLAIVSHLSVWGRRGVSVYNLMVIAQSR